MSRWKGQLALYALVLFGLTAAGVVGAQVALNTQGQAVSSSALPRIELEKVFKLKGSPDAVAWSPDGKLLATADSLDRRITIWDYASQKPLHTVLKNYIGEKWLTFTPDGRYLVTSPVRVTGPQNRISFSLIDVRTGEVARNVDGPVEHPIAVVQNFARHFAISPLTHRAATITEEMDGSSRVNFYETNTWSLIGSHKVIGTPKQKGIVADIAFNPANGELALLGSAAN